MSLFIPLSGSDTPATYNSFIYGKRFTSKASSICIVFTPTLYRKPSSLPNSSSDISRVFINPSGKSLKDFNILYCCVLETTISGSPVFNSSIWVFKFSASSIDLFAIKALSNFICTGIISPSGLSIKSMVLIFSKYLSFNVGSGV